MVSHYLLLRDSVDLSLIDLSFERLDIWRRLGLHTSLFCFLTTMTITATTTASVPATVPAVAVTDVM